MLTLTVGEALKQSKHTCGQAALIGTVELHSPRHERTFGGDKISPVSNADTGGYETAFAALRGMYLEDSWVLDVSSDGPVVTFVLDLVLTPEHPMFRPPSSGEQHCYRRARLTVSSQRRTEFHRSDLPPATDATGEPDFGNIDVLAPVDWDGEDAWEMSGSWGHLLALEPTLAVVVA